MTQKLGFFGFTLSLLFMWGGWLSAQNTPQADTPTDSSTLTADDFVVDGVPYAKVLYVEGNVWIRPDGDTTFHRLTEDEPIAAMSVLYTGPDGILDFSTGPGMATRMVPLTVLRVKTLPSPKASATPTTANPEACLIAIKKGTVFSALGREDGQPIDYQVRTPMGIAGARGTMFATSASEGAAEVSMLHGTVNFETPDHQTSQITAGESQQISGTASGKFQFGQHKKLNPSNSAEFFNHAGGLLEHASGNGVVRHKLGPDVAKILHEKGYALPDKVQERFKNSAAIHLKHRPPFNNTHRSHAAAPGEKSQTSNTTTNHPETTHAGATGDKAQPSATATNRPAANPAQKPLQPATNRRTPEEERAWERQQRLGPDADGPDARDKRGNR